MRRLIHAALCLLALCLPATANNLPELLTGHGGPIKAIRVSADGTRALTASFDYSIIHWDISGPEARILARLIGHNGAVNDIAFVPGSEMAVSVSDDGALGLWDLASGTLQALIESPPVKVIDIAVSHDGTRAATARWDGTAYLYNLSAPENPAILDRHKGNVNAAAFSADGTRLYTAAYDGQILEWDAETAQLLRPLHRHGWGINTIARMADGNLLFGALDGTVGVADTTQGGLFYLVAKSESPIQAVRVSPDGTTLAYADGTGMIEVFDASTFAKLQGGLVALGPVWDFDFLPGGRQIFHVGLDDFAMRWQIAPPDVSPILSTTPRRFQISEGADPGEIEFLRKCSVCHTLTPDDANRAGPTLYDLFGREAGTLPGYTYSEALKNSGLIWNAATLSRLFDDGPDVVVPGTKMPIQRLKSVARRDDLIRFLKSATAPLD